MWNFFVVQTQTSFCLVMKRFLTFQAPELLNVDTPVNLRNLLGNNLLADYSDTCTRPKSTCFNSEKMKPENCVTARKLGLISSRTHLTTGNQTDLRGNATAGQKNAK